MAVVIPDWGETSRAVQRAGKELQWHRVSPCGLLLSLLLLMLLGVLHVGVNTLDIDRGGDS